MPNETAITATSRIKAYKTPPVAVSLLTEEKNEMTGIIKDNSPRFFQQKPILEPTPTLNDMLVRLLKKNDIAKEKPENERDAMEQAICMACTLWENPTNIQRIEIITPDKITLPIIVLNRRGFLNEPHTWRKETQFIIPKTNMHPNNYAELNQYICDQLATNNMHYNLEMHFEINLLYQPHPITNQKENNEQRKQSAF